MKILIRILAAAVLVVVVLAIAGAIFLPDLLESEAVRDRIRTAAQDALDREIDYSELTIGLLPPSLVAKGVTVSGPSSKEPPLLAAGDVSFRVALLPLLARTVVVDSLVVDGAKVHLIRTAEGLVLPGADTTDSKAGGEEVSTEAAGSGAPVEIAVSRVDLRDCAIVVDDRAVKPATRWEASELQLEARGKGLEDPIDFDLSFVLASGGRVQAAGNVALGGDLDVRADLRDLALAPFLAYVDAGPELGGVLTGTVRARGPLDDLSDLQADLDVADGRFVLDDVSVAGPVSIEADVKGGVASPTGTFAVDATRARIEYGTSFVKTPGETATISGKIASTGDGRLAFDDVQTQVRNFRSTARIETGDRIHAVIDAPAFDISGWEKAVPALADARPSGPIRIEGLDIRTNPLDVRGGVHFSGVQTVLPDRGAVQITGALIGEGNSIRSRDLAMLAGGEKIAIDATLSELDRDVRYVIHTATAAADTNRIVSTLSSKRDFIYGILNFDGDFNGTLAGDRSPLETLTGRAALDIEKGRLKGVSLLQLTFDRMGNIGSLASLASQVFGGPDLTPYYNDDFKEIKGTFNADSGVVRTDDFRIVYRDYTVDLRGTLRLVDLAVDMTGQLTLGEKIDAALQRGSTGSPSTIKLARVSGTLDDPKVQVSPEVASAFLVRSGASGKVGKVVGDKIGGKTGGVVGDVLGGVLGGGSTAPAAKQPPPQPSEEQSASEPSPQPAAPPAPKSVEEQLGDAVGGEVGGLLKGVLGGGKKKGE